MYYDAGFIFLGDCCFVFSGLNLIDLEGFSSNLSSEFYFIYLDGIVPNVSFLFIIGGVLNDGFCSIISS